MRTPKKGVFGWLFQLSGTGVSGVDFVDDRDALVGEYSAGTGAMMQVP